MLIQKAILCVEYIQSDLHVEMIGYDTAGPNMNSRGGFFLSSFCILSSASLIRGAYRDFHPMSGVSFGAYIWDNIWDILSTMDNNPRCYMHLWCRIWTDCCFIKHFHFPTRCCEGCVFFWICQFCRWHNFHNASPTKSRRWLYVMCSSKNKFGAITE